MNYFELDFKYKGKDPVASAFAPDAYSVAHENIALLAGKFELPFDFSLLKLESNKSGLVKSDDLTGLDLWRDYLLNSLRWPLMSPKMRNVIEQNLTSAEKIDWIAANVYGGDEKRTYYILRFTEENDVLDSIKTKFVEGSNIMILPYYSIAKVEGLALFGVPGMFWEITASIYVSENMKNALQSAKLTGVKFEKIANIS
ncbi:imm11 family protein [Dawidia soli]|uniref:Immunity MXAN-0049 protein domain-containing protein n=1 Tax=Dawidia soli TaxID=2782352 RepID=A0AAP2DCR2_9BACT|nr:DUF1629 domain-containing protein [Dawidia soli]MBT1688997.1 hypothetical protein [Dawidia soli]